MQRRHFLQLSAGSLLAMGLPRFGFAQELPLNLPERLQDNPLLQFSGLPDFANIRPEHVVPAMEFLVQYSIHVVETLTAQKTITWQSFYLPLEDAQNKMERMWSSVYHLHSVKNSPELRTAFTDAQKRFTDYATWFGMYRPLYQAFLKLKKSKEYPRYSKAQKRAIDNALLDFKLSGVALSGSQAKRYGQVVKRLSELSTKFGNNVLDANMGWDLVIDDVAKLKGLTELGLASAKKQAESKGVAGYRFTLDFPSYASVVQYADDRALREQMFRAYRTRASDQGPTAGKWDNTAVINELLDLRLEMANLLGFKNYPEYALAKRMAESPKQVMDFLNNIVKLCQTKAKEEVANLQAYGQKLGLIDVLQPWDYGYLTEKQKKELFDIDKEMVRVYFPEQKVLTGMFEVAKRLFGIDVAEKTGVSTWHKDVRFFEVFKNGQHIASFYLDMYARKDKRGGAWMSSTIDRRRDGQGQLQLPVAQIVCNFEEPVAGKPALLVHNDVVTLFHEFGHGLHQMLTQVEVMAVSGINGVAWDAVEFPSQMLENWAWNQESLALISSHYQTGEPLPKEMVDKLLAAKNYHAATNILRQMEYALFDFRLNLEHKRGDKTTLARVRDDIKKNAIVADPKWTRMAHSFNHIFAGGYAAGYYSYMWADVLAVDAYSRFEKDGVFNAKTGQAYVDAFLGQGGSDEPMAMFRAFMGRNPKPDALLRQRGIL